MERQCWLKLTHLLVLGTILTPLSQQVSIVSETLDTFICLRANGFFPHDIRCDHFYECRNSTIINEGICKQGLRFDYRYRKKPRCIHSDQIDCRITQVEFFNTEPNLFVNTYPSTTAQAVFPTTTTPAPPTTVREFRNSRTFAPPTTTPPPTTLVALTDEPTTQPPPTTTTPAPVRPRHTHLHHYHHESGRVPIRHVSNHISEDDTLTKKRKLTQKPLKLRRGHLQEDLDDQHLTSRAISSSLPPLGRPKSIHCHNRNGYYADKEDCRKFYACDDGRAFPMSCPLGLAYDEMTGTCAWPDMVEGCRSEEMLRFTCPEPNENEILDYGDPRYPTPDCRKFVVCVVSEMYGTRTPRLLGCEEGLVFNPLSRSCDYPENVPSCANYYDEMPFARSIHHHSRSLKKRRIRL